MSAAARRTLAPLAVVTAAAFAFALLLVLVRLQWAPLESADHSAAARLNSLVAGHAVLGAWALGITWLGVTAFAFELSRQAGAPVTDPVTEGLEPEARADLQPAERR